MSGYPYLIDLEALTLAVCLHEALERSLALDLKVHEVPVLEKDHEERVSSHPKLDKPSCRPSGKNPHAGHVLETCGGGGKRPRREAPAPLHPLQCRRRRVRTSYKPAVPPPKPPPPVPLVFPAVSCHAVAHLMGIIRSRESPGP